MVHMSLYSADCNLAVVEGPLLETQWKTCDSVSASFCERKYDSDPGLLSHLAAIFHAGEAVVSGDPVSYSEAQFVSVV